MASGSLFHQQKKKKILCVDDEPDITKILRMALERAGYTVDTFNDPLLALKSFEPNLYSLVILDVMMQKMNGFELYNQLKIIEPKLKVCFLTATSEKYREEQEHCKLNKDLFLEMPLTMKKIIEEVRKRIG